MSMTVNDGTSFSNQNQMYYVTINLIGDKFVETRVLGPDNKIQLHSCDGYVSLYFNSEHTCAYELNGYASVEPVWSKGTTIGHLPILLM